MTNILIEILIVMIVGSLSFIVGAILGSGSNREDREESTETKESLILHGLRRHRT
jgi:hypothetical protein